MDIVHMIENVSKGANDRPVEDVIIANCGELPLDVDAEGNQGSDDDDDDDGHNTSNAVPSEKVSLETGTTSAQGTIVEGAQFAGSYVVIGLILVAVAMTMFVSLGGLRWLRRQTALRRSQYRKLSVDPES